MAKDVDLSSKEWRDIVFEGKNKDFGAYQLRKASNGRHNRAMIAVVIVIAILFVLAFVVNTVIDKFEARPEDTNEQELTAMMDQTQEEAPEEEEELQKYEEEKPEALPEEILNTVKSSEIQIVEDKDVTEEIKSQDDLKQDDRAIGQTNFDQGTDDINVVREHKEEVIVEEKKPEPPKEDNHVFTAVEQMPQFPGGDAALMKYISDHIRYPAMAQENNIQGRVVVQFVVTKTGAIGEVKVVRSKDPDLDKEAKRVVKSLPKFIPGKMNGQAVNVSYTLPINFKLQGV